MFEDRVDRKESFNNMRNREDLRNPDFRNSRESLYKRKMEMDRRSSISEQIDRIESE